MSTQIQRRRGTTSEHATFTGALGEITVDTDKKTVVVHDGATAGGKPLATESGLDDLGENAVRVDAEQEFDSTERETARSNVKAVAYEEQTLSSSEQAQMQANIGSLGGKLASKSANYTVVASDNGSVIPVSAFGANRTITLPAASSAGAGFKVVIKKTDSSANTVTIDGNGSETIDGAATKVLRIQYQSIALICDGTAWHAFAAEPGYEEGVFTPILTTTGTDFSSVSYDSLRSGKYTRIGNVVHVQILMITDSVTIGAASGVVVIGGLPYTAGASCALAVSGVSEWASNDPIHATVNNGENFVRLLYRSNVADGVGSTVPSHAGTGPNANVIVIAGSYLL